MRLVFFTDMACRGARTAARAAAAAAVESEPTPTSAAAGHLCCTEPPEAPDLPKEVVVRILAAAKLRGWELARITCVSRAWRAALTTSAAGFLWRAALEQDFEDGLHAKRLAPQFSRSRQSAFDESITERLSFVRRRLITIETRMDEDGKALDDDDLPCYHRDATMALRGCDAEMRGVRPRRDRRRETYNQWGGASDAGLAEEARALAAAEAPGAGPRGWEWVHVVERMTWQHWLGDYAPTGQFDWCCCICDSGYLESLGSPLSVSQMWAAHAALTAYWTNLAQPFKISWLGDAPPSGSFMRRSRRIVLPTVLQTSDDGESEYLMYTALATAMLRGRCRVCNRPTKDVHPTLKVPMCAKQQCTGVYQAEVATAAGDSEVAALPTRNRCRHRRGRQPRAAPRR